MDVDDQNENELDDRELPDESDMDSFDEPGLDACPHCRKLIHEDLEQCPHCGEYISPMDAPRRLPVWMIVGLVLIGATMILWMFIVG
ncbi:MAG TPA: hypothetical protein VHS31_07295 [Tepidisphaeraceae bacterium]|jgi:hypothetical protein|nr:hypothetical protein [Tepidisphaeraceae bacterium]